jgi:cytochrome P450
MKPGRAKIDFDHDSLEHAANWPKEFEEMRARCPHAWTEQHGGFWVATRYQDIIKIAQRPDCFTTAKTVDPLSGMASGGVGIPPIPSFRVVPNESESPEWNKVRSFLNPRFAPKAIEAYRAKTAQLAAAQLDTFIESGRVDLVEDYTCPLPAMLTMSFVGLPLSEWPKLADPIHAMSSLPKDDPERGVAMKWLSTYLRQRIEEEIAERHLHPTDDFLGYLAAGTMDGQALESDMIFNIAANVIFGGVDTTTALTSSALHYLALHPDDRRRLINEPALIPIATEEFLRYFTPIHGAGRTIKQDVDIDDWHLPTGDRIFLAYASANRDSAVFDAPDQVNLARLPNRHIAFGAGMHRCLGSFLARQTFEIMIKEVLTRMPDYELIEEHCIPYPSVAFVNGWHRLPAKFTPGPKTGTPFE